MQAVFSILAGIVALPSMSHAADLTAVLIHAVVDRRSCRPPLSSSSPSTPDWVLVSMLGEEPQRIPSHKARPHATSARPARSPTVEPPAHPCELRVLVPGLPVCARPPFTSCAILQVERT